MKKVYIIGISIISTIALLWVLLNFPNEPIDFNQSIRPILNKKCMACHGGVKQEGGLSFLFREEALTPAKSGKTAIIPGNPGRSELIRRIKHHDIEQRMPLEAEALSKLEIETLENWIKQGAEWSDHWAYRPLREVTPPPCISERCNQPLDHFIFQKIEEQGLKAAPVADRYSLIRRLYLDLTGLPPQPVAVASFISDPSSNAIEKVIDSLLASPHFGERWAAMWLDLARYADSRGYQKDLLRPEMWRYRDWVIDAFNTDMPFDEFTIHQLAGDLVSKPDDQHLLATAFHRNTMTNDEGGTDNEEFRVTAVLDRVNTTMEVWQATTIACVQCHSHPYDPIRHKEYYKLMAFFNNTADQDDDRDAPLKSLYSPAQQTKRTQWEFELNQKQINGDTLSDDYHELLRAYLECLPGEVPIMQELDEVAKRTTHVFEKGNWLVHGDSVSPDMPTHLPKIEDGFSKDRLGLAQWLVHRDNPLTSRVIVNRLWEQLFGRGLVATSEDFGTQGAAPSHPELLDWLAYSFVHKHKWHIKSFLKEITLSTAYQLSSHIDPTSLHLDPENIYLSRGPRYRLSAEQIRDQALAVSGLLHREVYGKSVMPYQPEGVWNVIRHAARWEESDGKDRYRRGLYTFWRRVSPYPSMMTFDTPSRELCVSRRIRTNTPLQALVLLNDPVYVEAAEALSDQMAASTGSIDDQIAYGFQLALMRPPDEKRLSSLRNLYHRTLELLEQGGTIDGVNWDRTNKQLAMIQIASTILNLDEFITRT